MFILSLIMAIFGIVVAVGNLGIAIVKLITACTRKKS